MVRMGTLWIRSVPARVNEKASVLGLGVFERLALEKHQKPKTQEPGLKNGWTPRKKKEKHWVYDMRSQSRVYRRNPGLQGVFQSFCWIMAYALPCLFFSLFLPRIHLMTLFLASHVYSKFTPPRCPGWHEENPCKFQILRVAAWRPPQPEFGICMTFPRAPSDFLLLLNSSVAERVPFPHTITRRLLPQKY